MARKLRIPVLYNEPLVGTEASRKYISENGQLQEGPLLRKPRKAEVKVKIAEELQRVDLSEIGVVEEMDDIKAALNSLGYKATAFNVDSNVFRLIDFLKEEKPDLIFNLVECVENESLQEMNIAGLYDLLKIPYTGASPLGLGIALNKPLVKQLLLHNGISTPRFQVFKVSEKIALHDDMKYPLIVKPSHEDASVGISDESVVYSLIDVKKRIRRVFEEFDQPALVEEYIEGRELNVAILGYKKPVVLPISEIDFSGLSSHMHKIVSYDAKWMHGTIAYEGTKGVCPAKLSPEKEAELKEIALQCFHIVGCRDYARIDFRLSAQGEPYVLEVNPNPDISDDAGFARSARTSGLTFTETVGKIVESALERAQ